ncbi:hypothetical protein SCMC78_08670 [Streptomyces sp. CMC78]|uniref:Arginase n=1 Tax=Streptomyces sp. CMC78 TaxID=3231512 RepID=A0AB33KE55_9ACTN
MARLGALEGGVVVPPRYDRGDWQEGDGVFNAAAIARYTRTLADRIEGHVRAGEFALVLGGDCSIQLGAAPRTCRHIPACRATPGTHSPELSAPFEQGRPRSRPFRRLAIGRTMRRPAALRATTGM